MAARIGRRRQPVLAFERPGATVKLQEHVPLAPYTTIGLGGPARFFVDCTNENELREAFTLARQRRLPVQVLGGGSNVIFPDAGFPGLVVRVALGGLTVPEAGDAADVGAGAGVVWDELVAEAVRRGLSGVECLSGIPGLVGGTPIQNVGAYGQEVAETILGVTCLVRDTLERVTFDAAGCGFAYRTSRFKQEDQDRFVVLGATFRLRRHTVPTLRYPELANAVAEKADLARLPPAEAVRLVRDTVLELRRRKSMVLDAGDPNTRSVGSFFVNPVLPTEAFAELERRWKAAGGSAPIPTFPAPAGVKVPAAWLVEQAGFRKGYRKDGVGISSRHALALVNLGGTTAQLLALAGEIERAVREKFGVRLEREPVVVSPALR
ncbi:MAG: UDP-N-acetylmuramate dehydrogenase [Gemmatimonadetes bacterium]|nr:UDP-N-acetylmuramate dehydrogenase [Gemmatimonadota bacterium]